MEMTSIYFTLSKPKQDKRFTFNADCFKDMSSLIKLTALALMQSEGVEKSRY